MTKSAARVVVGLFVAVGLLPAATFAQLTLVDSGPRHLKVLYQVDQLDIARQGASCLIGLPLEGEVQLEVLEARVGWRPEDF